MKLVTFKVFIALIIFLFPHPQVLADEDALIEVPNSGTPQTETDEQRDEDSLISGDENNIQASPEQHDQLENDRVENEKCFKGYADETDQNGEKKLNAATVKKCLCSLIIGSGVDYKTCEISVTENPPPLEVSKKAACIYYDDKYCPENREQEDSQLFLEPVACNKLGKIAKAHPYGRNQTRKPCDKNSVTDECKNNPDSLKCKCENDPLCSETATSGEKVNGKVSDLFETAAKSDDSSVNPIEEEESDKKNAENNKDNKIVSPFEPNSDDSPVNPIGRRRRSGGGDGFQSINPSGGSRYSGLGTSRGTVSGSQARVPGAGVGSPGDINTAGGAHNGPLPRGILQFPIRGEPGGNSNNNGGSGTGPGPGRMGGGIPPVAGNGGMGGAGGSASKKRRRGRRSAPKQSTRYMGTPGGGGGGKRGYSPRSSSMSRRVRKKMEENKKKISAKDINTLFQRELRRRGTKGDPQSFTPVFYFPDIERTYEEMKGQNQFLNEKGNDL